MITGCRPTPAPAKAAAAPPTESPTISPRPLSPAEVAKHLHEHHSKRNYDSIAPLIVVEHREQTISLLRAVDGVIDANAALNLTSLFCNPCSLEVKGSIEFRVEIPV